MRYDSLSGFEPDGVQIRTDHGLMAVIQVASSGPFSGPKTDSKSGEGARTEHTIVRRHPVSEPQRAFQPAPSRHKTDRDGHLTRPQVDRGDEAAKTHYNIMQVGPC